MSNTFIPDTKGFVSATKVQALTSGQREVARENIAAQPASTNLDRLDGTATQQRSALGIVNTVITVAASNTAASKKTLADFVCDGTADQVQIQAAIDAIASSGGKVLLEEGDYSITDTINITNSNITIVGRGAETVIAPVWNQNAPLDKLFSFQGQSGAYLTDVGVRDVSVVTDAPFELAADDGFIGVQWCRVWFQYCSRITIDNLDGTRVGFLADIRNCTDVVINKLSSRQSAGSLAMVYSNRVTISNVSGYDVKIVLDLAVCDTVTAVNIQGQSFLTLPVDDFYKTGIDLGGVTNCSISNFELNGFWYGISAKFEEEKFHNITIANGSITATKLKGIHSDKNANATGRKLGPMMISNVRIYSTVANSQGIHLNGYTTDDCIVGCSINVHGYGVLVEGSDNLTLMGNKIFSSNAEAVYVGKINSTFDSTNPQISNNTVSSGTSSAIWVSQAISPTVESNHVTTAGTYGIWMLEARYPRIEGNRVESCQGHGILLEWQSTTYTESANRRLGFICNENIVRNWGLTPATGNRGILLKITGITGAAYNVGSLNGNQVYGSGVEAGIILDCPVDLNFLTIVENVIQNVDAGAIYAFIGGGALGAKTIVRNIS